MKSDLQNAKSLREKPLDELNKFVQDKEAELLKLQFQSATGQLENTARPGLVRKEIARARTVLNEKRKAS